MDPRDATPAATEGGARVREGLRALFSSSTARNTVLNLVGLGAPLIVAIIAIPGLIGHLGTSRFGMLTLIWAVVSYFGLFDMGLGRALTQQLSVAISEGDEQRVSPLVWSAMVVLCALGVVSGVLLAALAPWGARSIASVTVPDEAINAALAMACAMPFIVLTSAFRAILEAHHAFGTINAIRIPMGVYTYLGPLAVVSVTTPRLDTVAVALALGRVIACLVHLRYAWRLLPEAARRPSFAWRVMRPLLASGGWLTISNVVSPFMGYVDRFMIGVLVSAAAVAHYATPNELVTKLWIIPGALTSVLLPTFAAQLVDRERQAAATYSLSLRWIFGLVLPLSLALGLFAAEILTRWIDPEFAVASAPLLRIFSFGILLNCVAQVPFVLLQGAGNNRAIAIVHCCEVPLFIAALWGLTSGWGVQGAALAWLLRMVIDSGIFLLIGGRLLGMGFRATLSSREVVPLGGCLLAFLAMFFDSLVVRSCVYAAAVALAAWSLYLSTLNRRLHPQDTLPLTVRR